MAQPCDLAVRPSSCGLRVTPVQSGGGEWHGDGDDHNSGRLRSGKSIQGRTGCRSEEDGGAPQPLVEGRGHGGTRSFKTNNDPSQQKGPRPRPHAGDTGKPFERSVACASSLTPTS